MKNLQKLFEHELKDLYSAEKQLTEALPKMVKAASNSKLKKAFSDHLEQTKGHMETVRSILDDIDINPGNTKCDAMEGLIKEGDSMIKEKAPAEVKDAGLIAAAQRIEHYEMAGYGTAKQYAVTLGLKDIASKLDSILQEESQCNKDLTKLAESDINRKAMSA